MSDERASPSIAFDILIFLLCLLGIILVKRHKEQSED